MPLARCHNRLEWVVGKEGLLTPCGLLWEDADVDLG